MARETNIDTNDQAYEFFVQEATELLQHLESGLMTLSQAHETQKIHGLMRAAHSIKGGAACIGMMAVQAIAHDLENGIRALYKEDTVFDVELEDLLLKAYDALQEPINQQIKGEGYDVDVVLEKAKPIFAELEGKLGHSLDEASELPEMQMDGDITEFIFVEEVPQALSRLEKFAKNPPTRNPIGELKSQIEVLATLGEMLNLSGFAAIAQTTASAIEANPQQYAQIASHALADFRIGQEAVINGDRTQGGEPSQALINLTQSITVSDVLTSTAIPEQNGNTSVQPAANNVITDDTFAFDIDELQNLQTFETEDYDDQNDSVELLFSADDLASLIIEDDTEDDGDLLSAVALETLPEDVSLDRLPSIPQAQPPTSPPPRPSSTANSTHLPPVKEEKPVVAKKPVTVPAPSPAPALPQPEKIAVEKQPVSQPPATVPAPKAARQSTPTTVDTSSLSVRLEMGRLNYLNNLVGELVTQDNSALLRNKQSSDALDSLKRSFNRFNKLTNQFQQYSKELVIKNPQARAQLAQFVIFASTMAEEMAQLGETIEDTTLINQQDQQNLKQRQQTIKQLEHNFLEARMLPVGDLLNRFPRTVRDLSVKDNKPVKLELEGTNTLVDRAVLSKLYDPLVHLVRNAFDHGIDTPEERLAAGKSEEGTIRIKAYNRGNSTYIEIQDDGRGINLEKIKAKAISKGVIAEAEAAKMSEAQVYELLFVPGFSTAEKLTHLSGRGVGLDAVRLQIRLLKGNISLSSQVGKGTLFTLRLPWSMTITKLLLFRSQESFFAIPVNSLSAIAAASASDLSRKEGKEYFTWQKRSVPLIQEFLVGFNYPSALIASRQQMMGTWARSNVSSVWKQAGQQMVLLLSQGSDMMGIKVDQILLEQNLVIKPFGRAINPPNYISGCTVLGDGRLVSVLDGAALIERVLQKDTKKIAVINTNTRQLKPKLVLPTVLVIDDSLTTRQTLSTTLQKAGYRVVQAQDGSDGLNQLDQHPEVEGIICDVEMPQMNGFEFLGRCRKKNKKTELPILMLTSRGSKRYRQLAQQLGANGYLTKPYLDQELIESLQQAVAETKGSKAAIATP
ncbi:MAG: response regulator [Limnothrix sp.]